MLPKKSMHRRRVLNREDALQAILAGHMETAPWNKIYTRRIWEDLRFPDGCVYEGTCTVFDIFDRAEQVVVIDDPLVMHRNRPDSICNTISLKNIQDSLYAREHYTAFVRAHTPELFQKEQLAKAAGAQVSGLMGNFIKYSSRFPKDREGREKIRELLIKTRDEVGLENCSLPVRLGYYPALLCPRLCIALCYPYRAVKKFRAVNMNCRG